MSFPTVGRDQGIIRSNEYFNTITIRVAKPECIACLSIAIALSKGQLDIRLLETSSQRGKVGIGIKLESHVVESRSLRRGVLAGGGGSCTAKQAQAVVFSTWR